MPLDPLEITDLLVDYDRTTREPRLVERAAAVEQLQKRGQRRAAKLAAALPVIGSQYNAREIDALYLRVHAELQRLHEEFRQGERVELLLRPMLRAVRLSTTERPIRVADVGCGLGYIIRWLAAYGELGDDVELVGYDYNRALVHAASAYAAEERLKCRFEPGDALTSDAGAHIVMSSGVLHHFRDISLDQFFEQHNRGTALGFFHFDIKRSYLAPLGAWIFHQARMREAVSRHDGTLSAVRAHSAAFLQGSVRRGAPDFAQAMFDGHVGVLPMLRTLHAVVGVRRPLVDTFWRELGPLRPRFSEFK